MQVNEARATVTFQGQPLHLVGSEVKVADRAPDFEAFTPDLKPIRLSSFKGKVVILAAVPSLDTPVCDLESRRFNQEASKLGDEVQIVVISLDLPFAQKRWCGANSIQNLQVLSDYRDSRFGRAYGVLIDELHLLARSIFVIDRDGVVRYREIVGEITNEPNYQAALDAALNLMK